MYSFSRSLRNRLIILLTFATSAISVSGVDYDQSMVDTISQVALDIELQSTVIPGVAAGVYQGDDLLWVGSSGVGNIIGNVALNPNDQYHIGSETKTYTGTVILAMVGEGLIGLDDTLESWLPDLGVPGDEQITIRNLLNMTSGIPDYLNSPAIDGDGLLLDQWARQFGQTVISPEVLITNTNAMDRTGVISRDMVYSNTNFAILGLIAEKASCKTGSCSTIEDEIHNRIVVPLAMSHTMLPKAGEGFSEPYTHGYVTLPPGEEITGTGSLVDFSTINYLDFSQITSDMPWAAGAMISNMEDQLKYVRQLTSNTYGLLTDEVQQMRLDAISSSVINGNVAFAPARYGLAIYEFQSALNGSSFIGHSGAIFGYTGSIFHRQDLDLYYVVAVNMFPASDDETTSVNFLWALDLHLDRLMNADGNCSNNTFDGADTCIGSSVRTLPLEIDTTLTINPTNKEVGGYIFSFEDCGLSDGVFSCTPQNHPIPALAIYGHEMNGLNLSSGMLSIEPNALVELYGNRSSTVVTQGDSSINIAGTLSTIGIDSYAINGGSGADRVDVSGIVNGNIQLGLGDNNLTVNGQVNGHINLNNTHLSGAGSITAVSGAGVVAPGNSIGSITIDNYATVDGHVLQLEVDDSGSDLLIAATSAILGGGKMDLVVGSLHSDRAFEAIRGGIVSGRFQQVSTSSRISAAVNYTPNSVDVALISPVQNDAIDANGLGYLRQQNHVIDQRLRSAARSRHDTSVRAGEPISLSETKGGTDVWLASIYNRGDWDKDGGIASFTFRSQGLMIGADVPFHDDVTLGAFVGFGELNQNVSHSHDEADANTYSLGLYSAKRFDSWQLSAQFSATRGLYDVERSMVIDGTLVQGKADSRHFSQALFVSANWNKAIGNWMLRYDGGVGYSQQTMEDYREKGLGDLNLSISDDSRSNLHARLGVELSRRFELASKSGDARSYLSPYFSLGFDRLDPHGGGRRHARYESFGSEFDLILYDESMEISNIGFGLESHMGSSHLAVHFRGEWSEQFDNQSVSLAYRYTF